MERVIEATASGIGNVIGFAAETGILIVVFAVLWLAFGAALLWDQGGVDAAWTWVRAMPIVPQLALWVLFLPVMAGLWVWESGWPLVVRLLLIGGLAGWNLLVFLPRAIAGRP